LKYAGILYLSTLAGSSALTGYFNNLTLHTLLTNPQALVDTLFKAAVVSIPPFISGFILTYTKKYEQKSPPPT
jgi:hypothetical protein